MTIDLDRPQRVDHFQVMRGIACLMVVLNHLGGLLLDLPQSEWDRWYVPLLVPAGYPWVWLFLALSGFLLTKAFTQHRFELNRSGILSFYLARARRLLPLLWSATILWTALFFLLNPFGWWPTKLPSWQWERELSIAFALPWLPYSPGANPISSVNSPVWSAIIEIHYCVLMPLLLIWLGKRRLWWSIGVWAVTMALLLFTVTARGWPQIFPGIYGAHIYNAGFFIAGMLIALHSPLKAPKQIGWPLVAFIVAIAMVSTQYITSYNLNIALAITPFLVLPAVCILIAKADDTYQAPLPDSFAQLSKATFSPLSWLERIGIMSYSVYLLHKPIGYIFLQAVGPITSTENLFRYFLELLVVTVPILVTCSFFYLRVENRYRRKIRKVDGSSSAKKAVAGNAI